MEDTSQTGLFGPPGVEAGNQTAGRRGPVGAKGRGYAWRRQASSSAGFAATFRARAHRQPALCQTRRRTAGCSLRRKTAGTWRNPAKQTRRVEWNSKTRKTRTLGPPGEKVRLRSPSSAPRRPRRFPVPPRAESPGAARYWFR
jgi:hypothetical protein